MQFFYYILFTIMRGFYSFNKAHRIIYLIILAISIGVTIFLLSPIIHNRQYSSFAIDPDVVYLANAITFIKTFHIYYFDHPGTPAIMLHGLLELPLVVYTKFVIREGFLGWILRNFGQVIYYARILNSGIFAAALIIFISSIYRTTKRLLFIPLGLLIFLSFEPLYFSAVSITAESTLFLLTSVWVFIFLDNNQEPNTKKLLILATISGFAVANRYTSGLLPILTLAVCYSQIPHNKIKMLALVFAVIIFSFLIGILPVAKYMTAMVDWILELGGKTGLHGSGGKGFISLAIYLDSIKKFANLPLLKTFFWAAIVFAITSIYKVATNQDKKTKWLIVFAAIDLFVTLTFLKYPLLHYQTTNFLVFIAITTLLFSKFKKTTLIAFILLLIIPAHQTATRYFSQINSLIEETKSIEDFASANPPKISRVWDWSRTQEFARIWARDYSPAFRLVSTDAYPNLLGLHSLDQIETNTENLDVFDVCWDQLFIQDVTVGAFMDKYKDKNLVVENIPNSKTMKLVKRSDCLPTKPSVSQKLPRSS